MGYVQGWVYHSLIRLKLLTFCLVQMDDRVSEAVEDDFVDFDNEMDDSTYTLNGNSKKRKRSVGNNPSHPNKKLRSQGRGNKSILSENVMTADILGVRTCPSYPSMTTKPHRKLLF